MTNRSYRRLGPVIVALLLFAAAVAYCVAVAGNTTPNPTEQRHIEAICNEQPKGLPCDL